MSPIPVIEVANRHESIFFLIADRVIHTKHEATVVYLSLSYSPFLPIQFLIDLYRKRSELDPLPLAIHAWIVTAEEFFFFSFSLASLSRRAFSTTSSLDF